MEPSYDCEGNSVFLDCVCRGDFVPTTETSSVLANRWSLVCNKRLLCNAFDSSVAATAEQSVKKRGTGHPTYTWKSCEII